MTSLLLVKDRRKNKNSMFPIVSSGWTKKILEMTFRKINPNLEIDWLGYHFSLLGISHLESKTSVILALEAPKTLKLPRSFVGSVHYFSQFIPSLAQVSHQTIEKVIKIYLDRCT